MERQIDIKKISEADSAYQKTRMTSHNFYERSPPYQLFSEQMELEIALMQAAAMIISEPRLQRTQQQVRAEVISEYREALKNKAKSEQGKRKLYSLVLHVPSDIDIVSLETQSFDETGQYENLFDDRFLSDDVIVAMLRSHREAFLEKATKLRQNLPELQEDFMGRVTDAVRRGEIPLSEEAVRDRVDETTVTLVDLLGVTEGKREWGGRYYTAHGLVHIADGELLSPDLEHIYTHEMVHALSGRTILRNKDASFSHQRTGLFIYGEKEHFRWLNEALTEELTMQLLNKSTGAYLEERVLFDEIIARGNIPWKLFVDAYFENFNPSALPGKRLAAWHQMQEAVTQSYYLGFLGQVDSSLRYNEGSFVEDEYRLRDISGTIRGSDSVEKIRELLSGTESLSAV